MVFTLNLEHLLLIPKDKGIFMTSSNLTRTKRKKNCLVTFGAPFNFDIHEIIRTYVKDHSLLF